MPCATAAPSSWSDLSFDFGLPPPLESPVNVCGAGLALGADAFLRVIASFYAAAAVLTEDTLTLGCEPVSALA